MEQGADIRVYAYGSYGHLKINNFPSFVYEPKRKDFQELIESATKPVPEV